MIKKKLRILQLAPRFPFPPDDGGKIGIANILKEFSNQGADVTFFSFYDYNWNKITRDANDEGKLYADLKLLKHSTKNTPYRIIKSIIYNHSVYIEKHIDNKIKTYISGLIMEKDFDVVHADHSCMGKLALFVKNKLNIPAGLRLHNIEWTIWKRYAENIKGFSPKKMYVEQQAYYLRKEEKKIYSEMDVCFPITEPDKERAIELFPEGNYIVAGAGVNIDEWNPKQNEKRDSNQLILATTYQWRHNVDAVRWFIEEIMPELRKEIPGTTLTLIGKDQPKWLSNYTNLGVNPIGYVDKVQPYLNKASVYIAPLFVGGGIRIKILEAMAMELPVVATPLAVEGINAKLEDGILLSEDIEGFVKNIIFLMKNPSYTRGLGKSARKYVAREFSWKKNVELMLDEYKRLAKFD
ncbi:MAG: glycosyltransferase [Bacteroidetes bacterium]|nr:MAG: glycosyltransferase [Bacteroidota bacterium]